MKASRRAKEPETAQNEKAATASQRKRKTIFVASKDGNEGREEQKKMNNKFK